MGGGIRVWRRLGGSTDGVRIKGMESESVWAWMPDPDGRLRTVTYLGPTYGIPHVRSVLFKASSPQVSGPAVFPWMI